jgi:hypothetical protein
VREKTGRQSCGETNSLEKAKRCLHLKVPPVCENLVKNSWQQNMQRNKNQEDEENKKNHQFQDIICGFSIPLFPTSNLLKLL